MIGAALTWLATSKVGRALAAGLGIAAAIGLAIAKVFSAGKAAERAKQDQQSLDALRTRAEIEDKVARMPVSDRAKQLKEWSRD